jgi:hypothetical protein
MLEQGHVDRVNMVVRQREGAHRRHGTKAWGLGWVDVQRGLGLGLGLLRERMSGWWVGGLAAGQRRVEERYLYRYWIALAGLAGGPSG